MFEIMKNIIKEAFVFEMDGGNVKRLVYNPFMHDYLIENSINFKKDVVDILIKTKFNPNLTDCELKEIIARLPFNKKIVFDYKNGGIEHE